MSASNNRTPVPVLKLDSRLSSPYGPSGDQSGNDNLLKMAMQSSPISKGAKETSTPQQQQPDWVAYYDEESGHEYLYNQRTGESKWPSPAKQQREPAGGYSYNNENADDSNTASQTGGGDYGHYNIGGQDPWIRGYDDHGQDYLYNSVTGESKWLSPAKTNAHAAAHDESDSNIEVGSADGGSYSNFFSRYYDDNGYEYFFNEATGESKWLLDAGDVLVNASSEEVERFADYGYDTYPVPQHTVHPLPMPLQISTQEGSVGSGGRAGGRPGSRGAPKQLGPGTGFWQDSLSAPGSERKSPPRARGPPPLQSPGSPYKSKANRLKSARTRFEASPNPELFTIGNIEALNGFKESDDVRSARKFERLKAGCATLRRARGELDNIVWLELQSAGQGAVFYCREGEEGGQWEKPLVFRKADELLGDEGRPHPAPRRPAGAAASLPRVDEGEREARAIYQQLKAREASGDLKVEYAELKRRTEEAKRKWNRFIVAAEGAVDDVGAGAAAAAFLDSDSEDAPPAAGGSGSPPALPAAETTDFDVLYARSIVVKQVWPWTCLVDMKTDRNFYRDERADSFTFEIPDCFKVPDQEEEDEFALFTDEPGDAATVEGGALGSSASIDMRHGVSAAQLVQRFKDELLQRRAFSAQSNARLRVRHTSAAQERGLAQSGGFESFAASKGKAKFSRPNSIFNSSEDPQRRFAEYDPPAGADPAGVERILASVRSRHLQHKEAKKERGFRYDKEAGALLDRLRRMAKPQPVEELAAEPGDGRVVKKLSARAIREKAEAEAERRRVALANELSAQSAQVHDIALRMVDIEDANEEGSWLEHELFRRHMLECAAMQRAQLVMPAGLLEAKAHPLLPLNLCCPHAMSAADFKGLYGHLYSASEDRLWERLDGSNLPPLWLHAKSGVIQGGAPFDELSRERKKSLTHEDWSDYERLYAHQTHCEQMRRLDLLSDDLGGLLFYCPRRDMYSHDGRFDVQLFEAEVVQRRLKKSSSSKRIKKGGAHQPSKKMIGRKRLKPSGSEKNVWLRLPPLSPYPTPTDEFDSNTSFPTNARSSLSSSWHGPLKTPLGTRTIGALLASKNTTVVPGLTGSIADFEAFLGTMVTMGHPGSAAGEAGSDGLDRLFDDQAREDGTSLAFERCFDDGAFEDYKKILMKLSKNPRNPVSLFQLALWLQLTGLGHEAFAVVVRANEALADNRQEFTNFCYCQLIEMKLAVKYHSTYPSAKRAVQLANMCPENEVVLAQVAKLLHRICYTRQAEQIFIGALLLNPLGHFALRGYAHLLIEKGNYHSACRYLARVGSEALTFTLAQVEMAWLQELMGADADVLMLSYKSCNSVKKDRASSMAFHSIGHFHHVRGEVSKAMDSYRRALYHHPNNAYALVLMSCVPDPVLMPTAKADSCFRRGLFLLRSQHRWAALLAYGEFVAARTGDLLRAQQLLREAVKLSFSKSVWPAIAYAHFLQYVRGRVAQGRRVLRWASRRHRQSAEEEVAALDKLLGEPEDGDEYEDEQVDFEAAEEQRKSNGDRVPLLTAMAYQAMELKDAANALLLAHDVLRIDPHYAAAHRLLGLLEWQSPKGRDSAAAHFTKAMRCSSGSNPYTLRTCSVVLALGGRYAEALKVMAEAVAVGHNYPLAWRALGIMTYLYGGGAAHAEACLSRAVELSGGVDVEAGRMRGLILLEGGRYAEARACFQQCLSRRPGDAHSLACLAMALAGLGCRAAKADVDYEKALRARGSLLELATSEDPEELFNAACMTDLEEIFAAKGSKIRRPTREDDYDKAKDSPLDAPPEILYWFGMYHLKRSPGSKKAMAAARRLFLRAVQRADCAPHALAIYMLGWVEECSGGLETAEKYYCYALQLEPIEPMYFLRLLQLVQDTSTYVKGVLKGSELLHKKKAALRRKNSRRRITLDVFAAEEEDSEEEALKSSKLPSVKEMRRRILLHQRVLKLSKMRERRLRSSLAGLAPADRLMLAFGGCDDWAALLRGTKEVREKAEVAARKKG